MAKRLEIGPQLPTWMVVGFTGHRALAQPRVVAEALRHALNRLAMKNPRLAGVSSGASGSDTLFGEEMVRRDAPLSLIFPFSRERFQRKDFAEDEGGWRRVEALMGKAIEVDVLHPPVKNAEPAEGSLKDEAARAQEEREADDAAYMDAGYRTVDRADVVIAVWDQKPARGFGGTAYVVEYARAQRLPLLIIDPESGRMVEERCDALGEDNGEVTLGGGAPEGVPAERIMDARGVVQDYFHAINAEAKKHGPRARILVRLCLQLYMLASALGFANLVFNTGGGLKWGLTIAAFLTLVAAMVLMYFFTKNHGRWLQCRVDAEVCRSFLATWDIRRHATTSHQPRPAIPGLRKLFSDLRLLRHMDRSPKKGMDETRSKYNVERMESQIHYFDRELKKSKKTFTRNKRAMKVASIGAVVFEVILLGLSIRSFGPGWVRNWLEYLAMTLPLVTTALGLTLITQESVRRCARYREMKEALEQLHARLQVSNTWDSIARVATEVEEELLQELVEWRSFIRFTRDVAHHG